MSTRTEDKIDTAVPQSFSGSFRLAPENGLNTGLRQCLNTFNDSLFKRMTEKSDINYQGKPLTDILWAKR